VSIPVKPLAAPAKDRRVSHYRVLEKLGGGGMGVVYRAEDVRLKRLVALKFLPERWSADEVAKRRFIREAQASSALDHPNICSVYEIDETAAGQLFIAMAFCSGETLKKKMERGPRPWPQAVNFAAQTLSGLEAAHQHGIVHRDLKPANLMVTKEGTIKIVDFGLAKLASGADITEVGQAVGTVSYMSPEQIVGADVDSKSDLWAMGVVLFEMLTGEKPFKGEPAAQMEAIRSRPAPRLSALRPELPANLEAIVERSLAKDPRERFATASAMKAELLEVLAAADLSSDATLAYPPGSSLPAGSPPRGVRLLPLAVVLALLGVLGLPMLRTGRSPPPQQPESGRLRLGVLAPELSVESADHGDWPRLIQAVLTTELTGAEGLGVLEPLTLNGLLDSTAATRGPEIYQALAGAGLDYVIDGSIMAEGRGHRLVVHLVRPETSEAVYSRSVDVADEANLNAAISGLAGDVLTYLQVEELGRSREDDLRPWISPRRHDLEALRAFIQATEYIYRFERGGGRYLDRAIALDPDFITARVWRIASLGPGEAAEAHFRHLQTLEPKASPFEQAMIGWAGAYLAGDVAAQAQHLEIALGFSPDNYILLVNLGDLRRNMGNCGGALDAIEPAVAASWAYPPLYKLLGECLVDQGRFEEATEQLSRSLSLDAVDPLVLAMLEALAVVAGDDGAADRYRELYRARSQAPVPVDDPDELADIYLTTGTRCLESGRYGCAAELLARGVQNRSDDSRLLAKLGTALFYRGEAEAARASLEEALALDASAAETHLILGRLAASQGDGERARQHYGRFLSLAPTDPRAIQLREELERPSDGTGSAAD